MKHLKGLNHLSPGVRKPMICICKTKTQISFAVTAKLISAFVFATWIVQCLFFLNTKFQATSHLQWLYSLVCVRPGQNPNCWFSHAWAHFECFLINSKVCVCYYQMNYVFGLLCSQKLKVTLQNFLLSFFY